MADGPYDSAASRYCDQELPLPVTVNLPKTNDFLFADWEHDLLRDDVVTWIDRETTGKWNAILLSEVSEANRPVRFFFDHNADAVKFKLRWSA